MTWSKMEIGKYYLKMLTSSLFTDLDNAMKLINLKNCVKAPTESLKECSLMDNKSLNPINQIYEQKCIPEQWLI